LDFAIRKKTILTVVAAIILSSLCSVTFFSGVIRRYQDELCETRAEEMASTASASIDLGELKAVKKRVKEIYDRTDDQVTNKYMGTPEFEAYVSHFKGIDETPEYRSLHADLRSMLHATQADSLYLFYVDEPTRAVVYLVDAGYSVVCPPGSVDYLVGQDMAALSDPEYSIELSISDQDIYGDIIGYGKPIRDKDGTVIGYMGVDISLTTLDMQRHRLILNTLLAVFVITLLFLCVAMLISGYMLKKPLMRHQELLAESEKLKKANSLLSRQVQAEKRIGELAESISALLANMPALTFSKDVINGKYLACNKKFAEYAHKSSPEQVAGCTDAEIFDPVTAAHFIEDDKIAIEMDQPYTFHEEVLDAAGNKRSFQTTKLKFVDATGRLCLLGMSLDVSEMVRVKQENIKTMQAYEQVKSENMTYSQIATALATDYNSVYYVDLNDDSFMEYSSRSGITDLEMRRKGRNFFGQSRIDAFEYIYREDIKGFVDIFTKENVLSTIKEIGKFVTTYRLVTEGRPVYVNMKAVAAGNEEDHIIVGVSDIDAQMRAKEAAERMKEEHATYQRISALSGDYICIYTVDPENDRFTEYTASNEYEDLNLLKEGEDFFGTTHEQMRLVVYEDDLSRCLKEFKKDKVMKDIEEIGMFTMQYRLMLNGRPNHVSLKAVLVEEKDGPQLIVGVNDIDAVVRREQENEKQLQDAKKLAKVDPLTGAGNKHAYEETEEQLNELIEAGKPTGFAVVVCDVNGLKQVNDTLGHKEGDRLIQEACRIIEEVFEDCGVYRIGGDEFAVVVEERNLSKTELMMHIMADRNKRNKEENKVVIACGMSERRGGDTKVADVFERADAAMYKNKKELKN